MLYIECPFEHVLLACQRLRFLNLMVGDAPEAVVSLSNGRARLRAVFFCGLESSFCPYKLIVDHAQWSCEMIKMFLD